jgi:hypothetical protein
LRLQFKWTAHAEALCDDLAAQIATKIDLESVRVKLDARIDGSGVQTKSGIAKLDTKIDAFGARLDTKIDALGARLDAKIDALSVRLDAKIDALGVQTKSDLDGLEGRVDIKFAALESRMLLLNWMCGFTLAAVMAMLWKLMKL